MRTSILMAAAVIGLAGCGAAGQSGPTTTTRPSSASTSTAPSTTAAAPASTAPATTATTARATTTTAVRATTTTARATTTTARPLTRAEATARLCSAVASADEAIQRGSFVSGGLRLGSGLAAAEATADPAVATAARSMMRAGLDGSPDAYAAARQAASTACARAGSPIRLGGPVQCVTTPCP